MQDLLKKVGYDPARGVPDEIDEHLYAMAAAELATSRARSGLLAKAYSDSEGDEQKARARYMKLRVVQMRREYELAATAQLGRPAITPIKSAEEVEQDVKDTMLRMTQLIVGGLLFAILLAVVLS